MSSLASITLVLAPLIGALLVGLRAYRSTLPARSQADGDARQLIRIVATASFGFFLIALALIAALDFRIFHMARNSW